MIPKASQAFYSTLPLDTEILNYVITCQKEFWMTLDLRFSSGTPRKTIGDQQKLTKKQFGNTFTFSTVTPFPQFQSSFKTSPNKRVLNVFSPQIESHLWRERVLKRGEYFSASTGQKSPQDTRLAVSASSQTILLSIPLMNTSHPIRCL